MADGPARAGFDADLRYGKERECVLIQTLQLQTVEIKSDCAARRTGRVFIEYQQRGRPSGLATTEATHWAIEIYSDTWLIVAVTRLRTLAAHAYRFRDRLGNYVLRKDGGDWNEYKGVVIPVEWFRYDHDTVDGPWSDQ